MIAFHGATSIWHSMEPQDVGVGLRVVHCLESRDFKTVVVRFKPSASTNVADFVHIAYVSGHKGCVNPLTPQCTHDVYSDYGAVDPPPNCQKTQFSRSHRD